MDNLINNFKKIREMQKKMDVEKEKPKYTLSYLKIVSGKCKDDEYDHLIETMTDEERYKIKTTSFHVLLSEIISPQLV